MKNQWPLIHIDDVNPYKNNPRINENAVPFTANSIHDFGFQVPVVVGEGGVLVTGHTRILACKELLKSGDLGYWGPAPEGLEKTDSKKYERYQDIAPCIPYVDASVLSPEEIDGFRLADNKSGEYSSWDYEKLEACLAPLKPLIDTTRYGFTEMSETVEVYDGADNSITMPDLGDVLKKESKVMVFTESVEESEALVQRLSDEGYRCKVV